MKIFLLLLLTIGLASAQTASPSASPQATPTPLGGFWRAVLPGGTYRVRLDRIQSVSTHEYTIAPLTHVTELTVETSGSVVTRFYYQDILSPQTPLGIGQSGVDMIKDKAQEVVEKVAGDAAVWKKVTKIYPTTTHAHTVEYRLESKDDIDKLMSSIEKAWSTNKGEEIKVN